MKWISIAERLPEKTGEYYGIYGENEKCFVVVQGGKVVKLVFAGGSQMSDGWQDIAKTI